MYNLSKLKNIDTEKLFIIAENELNIIVKSDEDFISFLDKHPTLTIDRKLLRINLVDESKENNIAIGHPNINVIFDFWLNEKK